MKVSLMISPFMNGLKDGAGFPLNITKREYTQLKTGKTNLQTITNKVKWCRKNCPDHPAGRQHALDIIKDMIKLYSPDEIYLDYIRYKDGYGTSCFCEYSQKQKEKFHQQHPEITLAQLDAKYAEYSLTSFVKDVVELCHKLDPKIKIACYTISSAGYKAEKCVKNYPLDIHGKYVSRKMSGPESTLDDTARLMNTYSEWLKNSSHKVAFRPIIGIYDPKTAERLITEFKIVYDYQKRHNIKPTRVEFYRYKYLLEKPWSKLKLSKEMPRAISKVLAGTYK